MLADRRTLLAGLAALPMAGIPVAALASAQPDPFTTYHGAVMALQDAINSGDGSEDVNDRLFDRWGEIDAQAMAGQPTTLAGAMGALQMARREFHQFYVEAIESLNGEIGPGERLILHLIDGAIAVLCQAAGGGVA